MMIPIILIPISGTKNAFVIIFRSFGSTVKNRLSVEIFQEEYPCVLNSAGKFKLDMMEPR